MAKKKIEKQINLLPQEEFDASTFGRTLKWLLGTFRYIVIATEMIVMVAFLSRFWLDAQSNDLIDSINQKKSIISSYSTFERQFRNAQNEIKIFSNFSSQKLFLSPLLNSIATNVPANVILTEVLVNGSKVTIQGESADENSAGNFVLLLKSSPSLHDVNLDSIESKQDSTVLTFKVNANAGERNLNGQ